MDISYIEGKLRELENRIVALEGSPAKIVKKLASKIYSGPSGAIARLIADDFLAVPKSILEVKQEMERQGYFYRFDTISTILRRDFMKSKRQLTRVKESGVWKYVVRK